MMDAKIKSWHDGALCGGLLAAALVSKPSFSAPSKKVNHCSTFLGRGLIMARPQANCEEGYAAHELLRKFVVAGR